MSRMKSLLQFLVAEVDSHFDFETFRQKVVIGASRNENNFRENLKRRGFDVEEELERQNIDSLQNVAAVQKTNDEVNFVTKEDLIHSKSGK